MSPYTVVVSLLLATIYQYEAQSIHYPARLSDSCFTSESRDAIHNEFSSNISTALKCGGTLGWRRVAYLDMTDSSQSCPSGLAEKYYSPALRMCGRATNDTAGCWSTFYNTGGPQYSKVCGRLRGYQFAAPSAFQSGAVGIDSYYVEGVSLTHGPSGNRTHIWTFTSGLSEVYGGQWLSQMCQCDTPTAPSPPQFVGNDYFCESGAHRPHMATPEYWVLFPDDPLWDGLNCVSTSTCCQFNNPPYFTKTLPAPTSDDIELRLCANEWAVHSDLPIDQVELYVQ